MATPQGPCCRRVASRRPEPETTTGCRGGPTLNARDPMTSLRGARLELVAVGLDHTTAPIELRERLAFAAADIQVALGQLTPLLEQAAILSTCNRVEVYGAARSRPARDELASFLSRYHGVDERELD